MPPKKQRRIPARLRHVPQEHFRNAFPRMLPAPPPTQIPASAVPSIFVEQTLQNVASTHSADAFYGDEHIDPQSPVSSFSGNPYQPLHSTHNSTHSAVTANENRACADGGYHGNPNDFQRGPHSTQVVQTPMLVSTRPIQTIEFREGTARTHGHGMEEYNYLGGVSTAPENFDTNMDGEHEGLYAASGIPPLLHPNYIDLEHLYASPVQAQQWDPRYFFSANNCFNFSDVGHSTATNQQHSQAGYDYPGGSGWRNGSWPYGSTDCE